MFWTVLVPQTRRAHNIELNGAVVIFDEAHNVVRSDPGPFDPPLSLSINSE